MESKKEKSRIFRRSTSPAMLEPKMAAMMRCSRRQLLKEKAAKALIPKNSRGAEVSEDEEEAEKEEEMEGKVKGKRVTVGSNTDGGDAYNSPAFQALADNLAVGATDQGFGIEEATEPSTMGQNTGDADLSRQVDSSDDEDETEKSHDRAPPEDGMYFIEAIKGSRMLKDVKLEFLVKWQGYEKKSDLTWEPEKTLLECAPEILSAYFDKIGGRDSVGSKRKRGRTPKAADTDSSKKLQSVKKPKVESKLVTEKLSNKGEGLGTGASKKDQTIIGVGGAEKPVLKTPSPKKRRGRPPKSKALEATLEVTNTSKTVADIVPAQARPSYMDLAPKSQNAELMSKMEQESNKEKVKGLKQAPASQGFIPVNMSFENSATHSSNDVAKKRSGRPLKAQGQPALPTNQDMADKETTKKAVGRPSNNAGPASTLKKLTPLPEGTAKKGPGRPVKSQESNTTEADQALAGSVVRKDSGLLAENSRSTSAPAPSAVTGLRDIPAKRGPGRPAKNKGPHGIEEKSKDDADNLGSPVLG